MHYCSTLGEAVGYYTCTINLHLQSGWHTKDPESGAQRFVRTRHQSPGPNRVVNRLIGDILSISPEAVGSERLGGWCHWNTPRAVRRRIPEVFELHENGLPELHHQFRHRGGSPSMVVASPAPLKECRCLAIPARGAMESWVSYSATSVGGSSRSRSTPAVRRCGEMVADRSSFRNDERRALQDINASSRRLHPSELVVSHFF
ncbi:hypothetical protein FN846DRAFT_31740 [Sphaerosporella brunnea]|uniref:Uncharacterized protein n=1 Tax=Sphaerosporella brunnea TaxID=1250544 RepID=A0A5J5EVF2_9PEZI|nr:hypothetical protein FN846DRAFT_31740 [Sphaerosporella brunnea]